MIPIALFLTALVIATSIVAAHFALLWREAERENKRLVSQTIDIIDPPARDTPEGNDLCIRLRKFARDYMNCDLHQRRG